MTLRELGPMVVGVMWMEVVICVIVLGLRIYTRTVLRSNLGFDDVLLLVTLVCHLFGLTICVPSDTL